MSRNAGVFKGTSFRSAAFRRFILAELAKREVVTSFDIAEALNISERTAIRHAQSLTAKGKIYGHRGIGYSLSSKRPKQIKRECRAWTN